MHTLHGQPADEVIGPQAVEELAVLVRWAGERYGVRLHVEDEGTVTYHLHDRNGGCLVETRTGGFGTLAEALIMGLDTAIARDTEEVNALYFNLHAGLEAAGLSVYPVIDRETITGWAYEWTCGCHGQGYDTEQAAITAGVNHHKASGEEQTSPRRHVTMSA